MSYIITSIISAIIGYFVAVIMYVADEERE